VEKDHILDVLAPCGLNCGKCLAFKGGDIAAHALALKELLGNFDNYARRFSAFRPVFTNYPQFRELLAHLSEAGCTGCRRGACGYPGCGVAACSGEKGFDFCFQCPEFPCARSNLDPDLRNRWIAMNRRMEEVGVESYYEETKNSPRYT
jgi:hypothetical protein